MLSTLYILTLSPALHDDDKKQTLKIEIEPAIVCFVAAAQQKKNTIFCEACIVHCDKMT